EDCSGDAGELDDGPETADRMRTLLRLLLASCRHRYSAARRDEAGADGEHDARRILPPVGVGFDQGTNAFVDRGGSRLARLLVKPTDDGGKLGQFWSDFGSRSTASNEDVPEATEVGRGAVDVTGRHM